MFQRTTPSLIAGALICFGAVAACYSAEAPKAENITVTGIVKASADTADEAATVLVNKVLYRIVKDAKGKIVAKNAGGKKAEIRGTVEDRQGVKWITVTWCALVE